MIATSGQKRIYWLDQTTCLVQIFHAVLVHGFVYHLHAMAYDRALDRAPGRRFSLL